MRVVCLLPTNSSMCVCVCACVLVYCMMMSGVWWRAGTGIPGIEVRFPPGQACIAAEEEKVSGGSVARCVPSSLRPGACT
jgi:hypothetical protein